MGRVAASAWGPSGIGRFSPKKDNPTAGQTAAQALPALYPAPNAPTPSSNAPGKPSNASPSIPGESEAITTAALVLLQLQKPKRAGLKDKADVVRSSLEAFVVKLVPIEQVSPSRTGPGRLAYIQAAPDYGVGMESW
jgi:hypothetical protein